MAISALKSEDTGGAADGPIRVMIVDDSAVIRGLVSRWLQENGQIEVVARAGDGSQAVRNVAQSGAEVVVLDIEMPNMDGITALPKILEAAPGVKVVMSSTLTRRNADISLRALSLGAADYVSKPESLRGGTTAADFQRELTQKVLALGTSARAKGGRPAPQPAARPAAAAAAPLVRPQAPKTITLQRPSRVKPRLLAVGSSTGGPQALFEVFKFLTPHLNDVPTVITQHMPPTFTAILAEHLSKFTGRDAHEGRDGEALKPGAIYIAPGDYHMTVADDGGVPRIKLDQNPPVNFCRPAVDPLFESVSAVFGPAVLAVVLTGMGHDGRDGGAVLVKNGGTLIAQDEATSVVWGMPGAVAVAGLCSAVVPLDKVGPEVSRLLKGGVV